MALFTCHQALHPASSTNLNFQVINYLSVNVYLMTTTDKTNLKLEQNKS